MKLDELVKMLESIQNISTSFYLGDAEVVFSTPMENFYSIENVITEIDNVENTAMIKLSGENIA